MKVVSLLSALTLLSTFAIAIPNRLDSSSKTVLTLNKRIRPRPPHINIDKLDVAPEETFDPVLDKVEGALEKRCDTCDGGGGGGSETDVDVGVGVDSNGGGNTNVDVNVRVRSGRPSFDFEPDDSGRGFGVDVRGYPPPRWVPEGWEYFGRSIGWAPYSGWIAPTTWEPPTVFVKVWVKVTWWSPPSAWRSHWYSRFDSDWYRYGIPTNWNWRPRDFPDRGGSWQDESSRGGWWWNCDE